MFIMTDFKATGHFLYRLLLLAFYHVDLHRNRNPDRCPPTITHPSKATVGQPVYPYVSLSSSSNLLSVISKSPEPLTTTAPPKHTGRNPTFFVAHVQPFLASLYIPSQGIASYVDWLTRRKEYLALLMPPINITGDWSRWREISGFADGQRKDKQEDE